MHYGRTLHEREAVLLRCTAVLPRASPGPYFARWLARIARLRATALALSGDEAQHVRFRRARAPRRAGDTHFTYYGSALHEREAAVPSTPARAPTCQPCPSLREVACVCSALARHCACSLWGTRPSTCASDARARRDALATLAPCTLERHCTSEKPPFLRRQSVLPRASPALHCARWLARVVRLRATALALSGEEAQHVRSLRARAAPRWRQSIHALRKDTARARSRPSSVHCRAPTCQPWPLLREVACACSALARHCAGSPLGRGPARTLAARAKRRAGGNCFMHYERALQERQDAFLQCKPVLPRASPAPHCARWLARVVRLRATALARSRMRRSTCA